jgi:excisionase family DNA binding protein
MPQTPDLITTAEVARIYGCHVRTVHRLVERGQLEPAIKAPGLRGTLFFRRDDVLRLAAERAA